MLELKELSVGYEAPKLLNGVNASIAPGQLCVLLGTNGVGKSTLLRVISGLRKPMKGEVCYREENMHAMDVTVRSRKLAIVLPQAAVGGGLRVIEIMRLAQLHEREDERSLQHVHRALAQLEITHLMERHMDTLSDGERQKVMIARALAQDTSLLVMDEPTVFLDYPSRKKVMDVLVEYAHGEGKTILCSSHDLHLVTGRADQIWVMRNRDLLQLDGSQSVEELEHELMK